MDGGDRRRSQYGQPYQTPAHSRALPGQSAGASASDRFSQPSTPARSDMGRSSITRPYLPGYPGYGYQEQQYGSSQMQGSSPMQGIEMQYPPAYLQDPSRQQNIQPSPSQQQQPQYAQYAPGAMLPPAAPQSLYDNIPFQQRQTAIEVMASQFAVPQYLPSNEQPGYLASQAEQSGYTQVPVTSPSLPQTYGTAPVDYSALEQQQEHIESSGLAASQAALEEGLREYHQQLRSTFDAIIAGRLMEASEKLLAVSRWLVSSVTALGLHHDDEARYAERLEFWREFNIAWEALGQKQKEMTEEAIRSSRPAADALSARTITSLVDDLVRMCDQLEQYGLVDYEMGVWEDQIIYIFTVCLDLLSRGETSSPTQTSRGPAETS